MKKALFSKLCCPIDKSELRIQIVNEDDQGECLEGLMTCVQCRRYYPIVYGIPIMTPDEYREKALEAPILRRWGLVTDTEKPEDFLLEGGAPKALK